MESHCEECIKGEKPLGVGEMVKFAGVDAYFVRGSPQTKSCVIISTDVFGPTLKFTQYAANEFSKKTGYHCVIPDLFNGDSLPADLKDMSVFGTWLPKHPLISKIPIIEATIKELKEKEGVQKIGIIGYCYGGSLSIKFGAPSKGVTAYSAVHPGTPEMPTDIEAIQIPGLYLCAETDKSFGEEVREKTREILKNKGIKTVFKIFPGVNHGFAIRGDENDEHIKKAKYEALEDAINFFKAELAC